MDFARSDEQQEVVGLARRILTDLVTEDLLREVDRGDGPRRHPGVWAALADAGLLGVAIPADQGGLGLGIIEQCLVLEEVGRTLAPVPVVASIVGAVLPLARLAPPALRERWVGPAVDGRAVVTAALAEPFARDPEVPATTATASGDGWVLHGQKTCVPLATVADAVLVAATTADGEVVVGLVEPGADGVAVEPQRTSDHDVAGRLTLDGAVVAADAVVASGADGRAALAGIVEWSTVAACAQLAGTISRALELTAAYTAERVQFDRPIATFQAVGQRAADAYIDVEATRLVWLQAAWALSEGRPAAIEVAVAKFWAADAAHRVAHTAVHLHGGTGVDTDHPIHRYFLAAKALEPVLGGATDQLLRIGASFAATRE